MRKKISVVTPTWGRPQHMERLVRSFDAQTWPDKELLVLDDSPEPDPFLRGLDDDRVRYHHQAERMSVGAKRNWLARHARGEVVAHFDDDDYYAPRYLETMAGHLEGMDLVKLSSWFAYSTTHGRLCYWDTTEVAEIHYRVESGRPLETVAIAGMQPDEREAWARKNLVGFGFSYVYLRTAWERVPFEEVRHGEDYAFVTAAMDAGLRVGFVSDQEGLALVVRHAHDSSVIMPQYVMPSFLAKRIFGDPVLAYLDS